MAEKGSSVFKLQLIYIQTIIHYCNFFKDISRDLKSEINYTFLENQIVNTAIKFIEENYLQEIDVNDIASSVHLNYSHLSRIFKKYLLLHRQASIEIYTIKSIKINVNILLFFLIYFLKMIF
jgi:YesN/AraC family two-component response regulator